MAVTTQESTEYANVFTTKPRVLNDTSSWHGRMRIAYFTFAQSGAGDSGSSVAVCKLPPGKVRLIGPLCNIYVNWTTASATLDAGWDAYTDRDGNAVAADADGLDDGVSVEAAGAIPLGTVSAVAATGGCKLFESSDGVTLRLTSASTAIADGDDAVGYVVYVQD